MTPLHSALKRALTIAGREYVITIAPASLKLTLKGHRKGLELPWKDLISGESALAVALRASIGRFPEDETKQGTGSRARDKTGARRRRK